MALLPVAIFSALLIHLGQRLIRSGWGSEGAEFWLGGFFASVGLGILPRFALAMGVDPVVDPLLLNLLAQGLVHLGACCFAAFVWLTFRRESPWARGLFFLVVAVYGVNLVLFHATGAGARQSHPFHIVVSSSQALLFAWGFVETLLYLGVMRRRLALGLADPVVTNRFFLLSLWTGGLVLLPMIITIVRVITLVQNGGAPSPATGSSLSVAESAQWTLRVIRAALLLIGLPTLAATWLAFFPPGRYERWIRERAAA